MPATLDQPDIPSSTPSSGMASPDATAICPPARNIVVANVNNPQNYSTIEQMALMGLLNFVCEVPGYRRYDVTDAGAAEVGLWLPGDRGEQQSEQHSRCSEKAPKNSMNLMDGNALGKTLRSLFTKDSHFGKLAFYH